MKGKKRKNVNAAAEPAAKAETPEPVEPAAAPRQAEPDAADGGTAFSRVDRVWLGCASFIVALATFLRFFDLPLRPFHHDEGVNAFFLRNLIIDGVYKYDPANYHGPTLYYIAIVFSKLFGYENIPLRSSVAVFGVLMVVLVLYLKDYLGRTGSLVGALLLAISPGMVFISRYFIHEIFFVFLSLAIVVSVVFFIEKRRAGPGAIIWMAILLLTAFVPSALNLATSLSDGDSTKLWVFRLLFFMVEAVLAYFVIRMLLGWDGGRPIYLILAGSSISLMFATKETAFITIGTFAIACVSVAIWRKFRPPTPLDQASMKIVLYAHAAVAVTIIYYNAAIIDGIKWLYNNVAANPFRPPEKFVFYSIFFLIAGSIALWAMFVLYMRERNDTYFTEPVDLTWSNFRAGLGSNQNAAILIGATAIAFAYLFVLFFSSFFTYAEGVSKAFEAYSIWTKTGNKDHTMHGYFGYVKWGLKMETGILILSFPGILIALIKGRHRFAMFTALWALGLFVAYSIIPYKTPWLDLSFILPMCMIAGYGFGELFESKRMNLIAATGILLLSGVAVLSWEMYELNFVRYDDDEMVYVYAHTRRGFLDLMAQVDKYAEKSGKGKDATIEIVSPDYWPMTWYTKDYTHANYFGSLVDATTSEMIVMKKNDQDVAAIQKYSAHYKYVGVYPLRPGVNLVLLVRNDLAEPGDQDMSKIPEYKIVKGYTD